MDEQHPAIPVFIAADHGQRIAVPRRDPLLDYGLAYVNMCARLYLEVDDLPGKMEGALQHVCNYVGVTFQQAVEAMQCDYEDEEELEDEVEPDGD